MKQKELKNLAKQIAQLEIKLQTEDLGDTERWNIENQIERLCTRVTSFEEMELLDEMIQNFFEKK